MAYKTRKTNKRNHLRRTYSKKNRRMYGGDDTAVPVKKDDDIKDDDSVKKDPTVAVEEVPTVWSNTVDIGNVLVDAGVNLFKEGIDSTATAIGADPNKSAEDNFNSAGNEINRLAAALNSPEGEKLKDATGKLLADSLEVLEPSRKKAAEIADSAVKDLTKTGTSALIAAAQEIPPIFAFDEVSKFVTAAAQAGRAVADLTTIGAESVKSLEQQKRKAYELWGDGNNLYDNFSENVGNTVNSINATVADNIASVQKGVTEQGKRIKTEQPSLQTGGRSMKKMQNEALMVGGRVINAQLEFLTPHVNSSQIIRQYGLKTKRRYNNRRQITKRRY